MPLLRRPTPSRATYGTVSQSEPLKEFFDHIGETIAKVDPSGFVAVFDAMVTGVNRVEQLLENLPLIGKFLNLLTSPSDFSRGLNVLFGSNAQSQQDNTALNI